MEHNVIVITPFSCAIEIIDNTNNPYYHNCSYDVYVNNQKQIVNKSENVFSIYDLTPNTTYEIKIIYNNNTSYQTSIITKSVTQIKYINNHGISDYSNIIQDTINKLNPGGAIIIEEGVYNIKPIFLKSDITIYLKENCHLIASSNRNDYPVLNEFLNELPLGTWEGKPSKMFAGVVTGINVSNVNIIGKGIIDGNAQNSDWWFNHKEIKIAARPRNVFLNHCNNILLQGIQIQNSAAWTIHPYFSNKLKFINLKIFNPYDSPNTDGCNPESSTNVEILGCYISVGDDCIAIKSGKKEMADKFYQPSEKITIRNCLMENGHGAVVLGSEISSGIKELTVKDCLFYNTDRGLRIKTRRGRGNKAIVDNVVFENIKMIGVKNPFVINMFYYCDDDGKTPYVQSKSEMPIDERTPYLGKFTFRNIDCEKAYVSAAFFYGLPEQKIKEIVFENVKIQMDKSSFVEYPAMMCDIEKTNQSGLYFNNVEFVKLSNLKINNQIGEKYYFHNVDKIIDNEGE